jgi:nitrite reductase (NO-forming)
VCRAAGFNGADRGKSLIFGTSGCDMMFRTKRDAIDRAGPVRGIGTMKQWIVAKVQEWLILGIGAIVIFGGLYAASFSSLQPSTTDAVSSGPDRQRTGSDTPKQVTQTPVQTESVERGVPDRSKTTAAGSQPSSDQLTAATPPAGRNDAPASRVAAAPSAAPASHDNHAAAARPTAVAQNTGKAADQSAAATALAADATAGRLVYQKCQACHSLVPDKNGLGPSLAGIVGKKAGGVAGFDYSPAMRASDLTWDVATLDSYLTDPQKKLPGNKMPFPGLKTENERSSVIAYLAAGAAPSAAAPVAQQTPAAAAPPAQPQPAATPPD